MATNEIAYPTVAGSVGSRAATRSTTEGGNVRHWQRVIPEQPRVVTFRGTGSTFRQAGNATATTQNLWSIENAAVSTVLVALRKLNVTVAQTALSTALPPWLNLYRITALPTGGTAFTKTSVDSSDAASNASVVVRGGFSSDTAATVITATASGQRLSSQFTGQLYSVSGGLQTYRIEMIDPELAADQPFILRAGQAYLLQLQTNVLADNIAARSFIVSTRWEEFSEY